MNETNVRELQVMLTEATQAMALAEMQAMFGDHARAATMRDVARHSLATLAGMAQAMVRGEEVTRDAA